MIHAAEVDALSTLVEQWHAAQREHGLHGAVMIARDNHTRELLNLAAREQLKRGKTLPAHGSVIGDREYAPGDRVIARRNDRHLDVDNGTLGTVIGVDSRARNVRMQTDSGDLCELDFAYVAAHLEHGYALTGHGAQGGTVTWAGVIGRPEEFTREWAYTALSRARERTVLHVIAQPGNRDRERQQHAPTHPDRTRAEALRALRRAMKRSGLEPLALEQIHPGGELDYRLALAQAARHSELELLAELHLRRSLAGQGQPPLREPPTAARALRRPNRGLRIGR